MKKKKISKKANNGSMLTQKTNEDFNKKKPVPSDFNEKKKQGENKDNTKPGATKKGKLANKKWEQKKN